MSSHEETRRNGLALLTAQYDASYDYLRERLNGLSDEEFFWEPFKDCWNLRRRNEVTTSKAFGKGEWRLDEEIPPPDPAPFTTIAWRLCHIVAWQTIRHDYTFGNKSLTWNDLEFPGSASEAIAFLEASHQAWRKGLAGLSNEDLDTVGFSSNPWGYDPRLPFGDILWWTNRELIHHAAEIGMLRDWWRHQFQNEP